MKLLHDGELKRGRHVVTWDGTNASGQVVASGMYLLQIETPRHRVAKPMTLLK
ncbi:MAG: FlgD immunoglobulin-like domain containing protein [candidate division KSB1 bacterium]|nr:FlgD immunoglobulin-like domain containing protein [candidate division KSB1 bacterium]